MPALNHTPQKEGLRIGKDELNLADWRISVPTHKQPRRSDGDKLSVVEYEIPVANGTTQKVTLMAPSHIGLPTPGDEDLLIALLYLAKKHDFQSDIVRFGTTQLCSVMRKTPNQATRDRIEAGLTRLKALTIKYELAWYDKVKAQVEPVLITGILAEAKFVRRKERRPVGEPHDSYVQWTKSFYQTITAGNVTDIDLDLYFSFSRPGTKQLYRHLNKRFYGRRQHQRYERDLIHLACGHLGMKKSKYLKRNLDQCIRELEESGYIVAEDAAHRYRKVRPGVWRVGFRLDPNYRKTGQIRSVAAATPPTARDADQAVGLVCRFYIEWTSEDLHVPSSNEITTAKRLIAEHGIDTATEMLPRLVKVLKQRWPECRTFMGAMRYLPDALSHVRERRRRQEQRQREDAEYKAERRRKESAGQRETKLESQWQRLSPEKQQEIRSIALIGHPRDLVQRRPKLAHSLCLEILRQRQDASTDE